MNLDVRKLQEELKEAYRLCTRARRNIKLPSTLSIECLGEKSLLRLNAGCVTANMQTDAAAFEAWALTLRLWLGEKRFPHIVLDWEAPPAGHNAHYERFLYRVAQFQSLFRDWFEVADQQKLDMRRTLTEPLILNVASGKASPSPAKRTSPEHQLELDLIGSKRFCQHFGLKLVDHQFPVGLFARTVSAGTRIFTGGKSAIDIVGVGEDKRFWIFELKAGMNISAGTLSELLLYTSLIREAAQTPPRIQFDDAKPNSRARVDASHVKQCTGINAVMLVENLHPLLEHPELLSAINSAAEANWNCIPGAKPVCFSKALVREFDKVAEARA